MVIRVPTDLSTLAEREIRELAEQCDSARLTLLCELRDRARSTEGAARDQQLAAAAPWAGFVLTVLNKKTQMTFAALVGLVVLSATVVECLPSFQAIEAVHQQMTSQSLPETSTEEAVRAQQDIADRLWGSE
jgi:hypothetical protein